MKGAIDNAFCPICLSEEFDEIVLRQISEDIERDGESIVICSHCDYEYMISE